MMHAVPRWRVFIAAVGVAALYLTFEAGVTAQQLPDPNAPLTFMLEPDTNRPGGDLRSFALPRAHPDLCREACAEEPQCQAFTYVNPGIQGPDAVCWLKSEAPAPVPDSCCYSGVKLPASGPKPIEAQASGVLTTERRASPVPMARDQLASTVAPALEPDTDRPGGDLRSFVLPRAHPDLCQQACAQEPQCQAFTYVKPGVQGPDAVCWLKSEAPAQVPDPCCVSGLITRESTTGANLTPIQLPAFQAPSHKPLSPLLLTQVTAPITRGEMIETLSAHPETRAVLDKAAASAGLTLSLLPVQMIGGTTAANAPLLVNALSTQALLDLWKAPVHFSPTVPGPSYQAGGSARAVGSISAYGIYVDAANTLPMMVQNDLFILESPGPVIIGIVLPPGAALYALAIHAVDLYTGQAVNGVPVADAYVCSLRTECPISLAGWQNVSSESWLPLVQNSANTALVGLFSGTGDTAGAPGVLLVVRIVAQNVVFAGVTVTRM